MTDKPIERRYCVLVPAYREEGRIGETVAAVLRYCPCVVVIDDGSDDGTADEARRAGAVVLRHKRNQGKGKALETGFDYARREGFEFLLTLDGDGQHDAADIPAFVDAYQRGSAAVLVGNRMSRPESMPWLRRLTNRFMSGLLSRRMGQRVPDTQCGYRLFRCDVLPMQGMASARFAMESEILLDLAQDGVSVGSVPIRVIYRDEKSKINPLVDTLRFFRMLWLHGRRPRRSIRKQARAIHDAGNAER